MDREGDDGLHASDKGIVYEGRGDDLASKRVSPKGPASGLRMLNYFINRGGKGLTATRRRTLERAKAIMMQRLHSKKTNHSSRSKRAG